MLCDVIHRVVWFLTRHVTHQVVKISPALRSHSLFLLLRSAALSQTNNTVCVHSLSLSLSLSLSFFLLCMEKKEGEWVHVLLLLGFTHWADKQSIPIKASCSPGGCRRGRAPSDHIILWKPPQRLADCDLKGNRALQEQLVWPGSGERAVGAAVWLQLSPETSTENSVTAEVEGGGGGGGGGEAPGGGQGY